MLYRRDNQVKYNYQTNVTLNSALKILLLNMSLDGNIYFCLQESYNKYLKIAYQRSFLSMSPFNKA